MQILHPFAGSVQQYNEQLSNPDAHRPSHCPQCQTKRPLSAHGFYTRTLIDTAFDGVIRVRRYLCHACRRTVSLLPEFILPYLRSSLMVMALFLLARLLGGQTLPAAAKTAPPPMPYQRGQFWVRRFRAQAQALCAALAALTQPAPAPDFVHRARPCSIHRLAGRGIDDRALLNGSARAATSISRTSFCRRCGISSAATWKSQSVNSRTTAPPANPRFR